MLATHPDFQHEFFKIETVKNACLQSTLMCIRDWDDFFSKKDEKNSRSRESDIRADGFLGYKSPGQFLGTKRDSINQRIAHLTYHPVWEGTTGIAQDKNLDWDTVDLVGKATRPACEFMGYLVCFLSEKEPDQAKTIHNIKLGFEQRLKIMEEIVRGAVVEKSAESSEATK